jgi:ABC-type sugar transport system substrate-binding protein
MPKTTIPATIRTLRSRRWVTGALIMATGLALAACSSTHASTSSTAGGGSKLILFELSFPCGLNDYASQLCAGVRAEAKTLPPAYKVEVKTGVDYSDVSAYNSLIQTSMQLHPAGMILFVNGPAAQTPFINQACAQHVKMILVDSPATGVKRGCQSSFIGADHYQLGVEDAKWLIAHPPANGSKQVGIVTQPPGEYASTDARVRGFTQTITAAGYQVVATAVTNLSLDTTRTEVTNMVTAHPDLGAIFSANGPMGDGTVQALKNNHRIVQLTLDGFLNDIPSIINGTISADAAQDPYAEGKTAVHYMAEVLQSKKIPALTYTPSEVVSKESAKAYLSAGGLH